MNDDIELPSKSIVIKRDIENIGQQAVCAASFISVLATGIAAMALTDDKASLWQTLGACAASLVMCIGKYNDFNAVEAQPMTWEKAASTNLLKITGGAFVPFLQTASRRWGKKSNYQALISNDKV